MANGTLITVIMNHETGLQKWREAVREYFKDTNSEEDLREGLSATLTFIGNRHENPEYCSHDIANIPIEYLTGTLNEIDSARQAMGSYVPEDDEEREAFFLCLREFPHKELINIQPRLLAEFASAIESGIDDFITLGSWVVAKLKSQEAAEVLANFIASCPNEDLVNDVVDSFLAIGQKSEDALFQKFVASANTTQTQKAMQTIANDQDASFSSDVSIQSMESLLSLEDEIAMQALGLVYRFKERKSELVDSLQRLHGRVLESEETEWQHLVQQALNYAQGE